MRNIQKNIIPKWTSTNTVSELIEELPNLCNDFEYQLEQSLLPIMGEYFINSYKYDINDFFRNQNNKCFKIKVPNKNESENKTKFYARYLVITSVTFIILEPIDEKYKNICRLNYVGDLFEIKKIDKYINTEDEYKDLSCFQIKWNKNYNNQLTIPMCGDTKTFVVKNICECLEKRKDNLKKLFKIIQKSVDNNINTYEKIIDIKKKLIEEKINDSIYEEISSFYQKIIEILASSNGDSFQTYLAKLKNFIDHYDKLKTKMSEKNKPSKNK